MNILKLIFSKAGKIFLSFILEVFNAIKQQLVNEIKDFAIYTVTELAKTNFSNEEKRSEAFKRIKNYASVHGLEIKDSLINLTIELAVNKIKG